MANPYETLGVAANATEDEIRKAYRKAAKETHPDLNPGNRQAEKRFKEINAAHDIIGDPEKRRRYDAGEIDETGAERPPERHFYREYAEAGPNRRYGKRGSADDFDIFADLFGGRPEGRSFRMPPRDVRYTLEVVFLEAANGAQKRVVMPDGKTLDIAIPAGIEAGDAYVEIAIRPHPGFRREGHDIVTTLPVSLGEALNGATVRVETVKGPIDVAVPKLARDGMKLRLRGKGVARGKAGGHGDQIVEVRIVPPEGADEALARFMAEWEKTHPQNPRGKGAS
jgi:DnaJ-class molecular chaperone